MEETNEERTAPTPRSIGIKYGLISTAFSIAMFLILVLTGVGMDSPWRWAGLPITIAIIVLAQNAFKNEGDGFMTFGQGFAIGFWMGIVSLVIGGIFTFVYTNFIDLSVMEDFYRKQVEAMQEKGTPDDQIETIMGYTKKLYWPIYMVFGLIFSAIIPLIVTIFTQKKNPQGDFN